MDPRASERVKKSHASAGCVLASAMLGGPGPSTQRRESRDPGQQRSVPPERTSLLARGLRHSGAAGTVHVTRCANDARSTGAG